MSDGVSPYDCATEMRRFQREARTCLNCPVSETACDDTSPLCPFPSATRKKRKYHLSAVARLSKSDAGRSAAAARRKTNG